MTRCFHSNVAEGFVRGRLSSDDFARVVAHASQCADCRHLLFTTSRPGAADLANASMESIQERLTAWRAARRAPLMPAFLWRKGHAIDRYVITRSVGGTEDGVIYEAFDSEREDRVVVKQLDLHIDDPATPGLIALAQRLCQLSHPNLLQMLSVGVHEGFVYLVYEFMKGTTLLEAGADDPRQILALFAEAGRGLAAAHDAGIAHGGFSGASCVVGRDGRVKVLDFGVGEARIHRVTATRTTRDTDWTVSEEAVNSEDSFIGFIPAPARQRPPTGQFESIILAAGPNSLGPRLYAAPELVLGAPPSAASDQFAFCASLFHRLYGQPPYHGDTISLWLRELLKGGVARPPMLPEVLPAVQAALLRGLERDPAGRFPTMEALLAKLGRPRPVRRPSRVAVTAIAVGAVVAAAGGIAIGALHSRPGADSQACDHSLDGWSDLWTAARQDALLQASAGADLGALRTRLDGWVGSWRESTGQFCRMPADHPQSAECAGRAHAIASDLLDVAQHAPARLARAAAAIEALPTYDQCLSPAPSPASAPLDVVKADVRRRFGLLDEADQLLAKPADDPAQRGYQAMVRGYIAADRGDVIAARRQFEDATFEAQAGHQPELGASAALQRLALACAPPERALWTGYLEAQTRLADKAPPEPEYSNALAQSLACEGKLAESLKLRQRVVRAMPDAQTPAAAIAAHDLARALLAQGELGDADIAAHDAATAFTKLYGPHHPQALAAQLTLAEIELPSPPSSAAAEQAIARVLAEIGDRKDPDALRARALLLQGELANARGNREDALRLLQRASQEYEAALGGTHPELAAALLATGDQLLIAGRDSEAEASYRQVAAIYDTLGQTESAGLAHARAGIALAHWGDRPPADATETLQWGLAPTGGGIDPAVTGWLTEQLGRRAAARGDQAAALAQYRAAATAWQQSGDRRGLALALTEAALLAFQLRDPDARAMLEDALQIGPVTAPIDRSRLESALARLLWPDQRDRARALARAALADLPDTSSDAADLKQWLRHHDTER